MKRTDDERKRIRLKRGFLAFPVQPEQVIGCPRLLSQAYAALLTEKERGHRKSDTLGQEVSPLITSTLYSGSFLYWLA